MSSLDKVVALSVTVACTVGLEPPMFPMGPTEVMVTPSNRRGSRRLWLRTSSSGSPCANSFAFSIYPLVLPSLPAAADARVDHPPRSISQSLK